MKCKNNYCVGKKSVTINKLLLIVKINSSHYVCKIYKKELFIYCLLIKA
jgi:hypothetical protein